MGQQSTAVTESGWTEGRELETAAESDPFITQGYPPIHRGRHVKAPDARPWAYERTLACLSRNSDTGKLRPSGGGGSPPAGPERIRVSP